MKTKIENLVWNWIQVKKIWVWQMEIKVKLESSSKTQKLEISKEKKVTMNITLFVAGHILQTWAPIHRQLMHLQTLQIQLVSNSIISFLLTTTIIILAELICCSAIFLMPVTVNIKLLSTADTDCTVLCFTFSDLHLESVRQSIISESIWAKKIGNR